MKKNNIDIEVKRNGVIIYSRQLPIGYYTYNEYGIIKMKLVKKFQDSSLIVEMILNFIVTYLMIFIVNFIMFQIELNKSEVVFLYSIPAIITAFKLTMIIIHYKYNDLGGIYVAISKVINIYEKKHYIPNIRELKHSIPFRCTNNIIVRDISLLILEIIFSVLMYILYSNDFISNVWYSVLLFTLTLILSRVKIVNIIFSPLQCVILSKASFDDIKLARKAIENYEKMENKIKNNFGKSNFWLRILYG